MALDKASVMQKVQQLMRKSQWEKALDAMKKLYEGEKSDPMVSLRLGDLFLKTGDKKRAAMSYYNTAGLFADSGYEAKAIATYKMILRIEPDYEDVEKRLDNLVKEKASTTKSTAKKPGGIEVSSGPAEPSGTIELSQVPDTGPVIEQGSYGDYDANPPDEPSGGYGNIELSGASYENDTTGLDEGIVGGAGLGGDPDAAGEYPADSTANITRLIDTGYAPETDAADETPKEGGMDLTGYGETNTGFGRPETDDPANPIPLFSHMPKEELREMLDRMTPRSYDADEVVVSEGEQGASLYIIKSGGVRVVTSVKSMEVLLAELGERDFFGEVSFLTGRPRTADIVAAGPTEVLELSGDELEKVVARYPEVESTLRMFHENRVSDTLVSFKAVSKEMFS